MGPLRLEWRTTDEPVETDIIPPRSPRPEPSTESRSRTPETSNHCLEEERPGISDSPFETFP